MTALVHDFLLTPRGAERTFVEMAACWPGAPVYTTLYDHRAMGDRLAGHTITASGLNRLGLDSTNFRGLLPVMPRAVESLPVDGRPLVVSSSSAFAHGVRPDPGAVHVCYCHTPFRYVWHERERALTDAPGIVRRPLAKVLDRVRAWDVRASGRVTHYVANSRLTQSRIAASYGRDSTVIHPPVDTKRFGPPRNPDDYFLFVGEVTTHKRVEYAIEAARAAGAPLKVVGDGPDRARLSAMGLPHIEFLGRLGDDELRELMAHARALIVPNVEEFGIAAVEGMAAGRPVVAPAAGGTLETVVDGVTGVLFDPEHPREIAEILASVDFERFDGVTIAEHARRFSAERFRDEFRQFVERAQRGDR
jgi:glycosyltransferase involved in cell wall biosynthesis